MSEENKPNENKEADNKPAANKKSATSKRTEKVIKQSPEYKAFKKKMANDDDEYPVKSRIVALKGAKRLEPGTVYEVGGPVAKVLCNKGEAEMHDKPDASVKIKVKKKD